MTTTRTVAHMATEWDTFWAQVGNEDWLAAARLMDLSPRVAGFYATHLNAQKFDVFDDDGRPCGIRTELVLDWEAAAKYVAAQGFSSTQDRLARLVAALTTGRPYPLSDLALMGSWQEQVWAVLAQWGTSGQLHTVAGTR